MKKSSKKFIAISTVAVMVAATALIVMFTAQDNVKIQPVPTVDVSSAGIDASEAPFRLIAQRGLAGVAPENTRIAIEKAGRESFAAVEFDVCETLDGVWVLMRGSTLGRMTNGHGKIKNLTYFDLLNFTIDNGANIGEYTNVKIAELEEILDMCAEFGMQPYINIQQGSAAGITKLTAILSERLDTQNCAVLSCNKEYLLTVKNLAPSLELWLIAPKLTGREMKWLEENEWAGVAFDAGEKANTQEKIKALIQAGHRTGGLNLKDPQTIKSMYSLGVTDFYTDCVLPK